jgi:hypothetical protein
MTYARARQENPDKSPHESLEAMFDKLTLAQRVLGAVYYGPEQLRTTIIRACRGCPELEQALFTPKISCEELFSDLRSALQLNLDRQSTQYLAPSATYYTDRRYTNNNSRAKDLQDNRTLARKTLQPFSRGRSRNQGDTRKKKCFICHKEGCWSSNHPRTDRLRARRQYIASYEGIKAATPSHEEVDAFITQYEGESEGNTSTEEEDEGDGDDAELAEAAQYLTNTAFLYRTTQETPNAPYDDRETIQADHFVLDGRYRTTYQGELWDTGAAKVSTVGKEQLEAYLKENPRTEVQWNKTKATISFGGQNPVQSLGSARIHNPLGTVTYHILDTPTPFLLSLADADRLGAYYNNVLDVIVRKDSTTIPVVRKWGHPFFNVRRHEKATSFFTETELRRLHRRFGHPRTERLHRLLTTAGHDTDATVLDEIRKFCHFCQTYGPAPSRFKFSIKDDTHFNYEIIIDSVQIGGKHVLHVIDADTSFQAATFLKSMSARHAWEALCRCWINTYQGPPDYIVHDPGTNFAAEDFQARAKIVGVECKQMPVEAHWAMGKVERAHAPLRRAFNILKDELGDRTDDENILQMAVKALNDTAGPDGLVPTLLVFGAYPRINIDSPPSPDIIARAKAIQKATKMIQKERANVDINRAINTRNGPKSYNVLNLPLMSEILIWREKKGWTGPYKLASIDGRDVTVELENGPLTVRCTQAKPYYRTDQQVEPPIEDHPQDPDEPIPIRVEQPVRRKRGRPRKDQTHHATSAQRDTPSREKEATVRRRTRQTATVRQYPTAYVTKKEQDDYELALKFRHDGIINTPGLPFENSDRVEIEALIANGTFQIVRFDPSKDYGRIFNLRLVREIKGKNTQPYEKSRLVMAGHSDKEKETILTQSPTIQRMSQRLLLAIGSTLQASHGMHFELRDIAQAYVQSKDKLQRTLWARPPKEARNIFAPDSILKIVRPLYGAAESGLYWFKTYHNHHKERLQMKVSTYDTCLLITHEGSNPFGITGLQTDDTLSIVTQDFSAREEKEL